MVKCWNHLDTSYNKNTNALYATNTKKTSYLKLDSRVASHMKNDGAQLINPQPCTGIQQVTNGNGELLPIQHSGQGLISIPR